MTKFALALAAVTALGGSAVAADLPVKAPPPVPVVANWTGFYLNGGLGYGMWTADTTTVFPLGPATGICDLCVDQRQGGKGWLAVVGAGYDYQITSKIVGGAFVDLNWSSLKGTIQDQSPFFAGEIKQNWSWAVGGRLGFLITPEILSYSNAGFTRAHFSGTTMLLTTTGAPLLGFGTPSFSTNGWFLGGGIEASLASSLGRGWYMRSEYRLASYDKHTLADTIVFAGVVIPQSSITFKPVVQTVTAQLVYKLHTPGGAAVIAAPSAPVNWSGVYANVGLGYGLWAADTSVVGPATPLVPCGPVPTSICQSLPVNQVQGGRGWLGLVGIGYDHLVMPKIVVGVFADFNWSSLKGTIQDQGPFAAGDINQNNAWAAGGRVGYLITPEILSYMNGGFTSAHFSGAAMVSAINGAPLGFATASFTTHGWFLGGGMEASLASVVPGLFWRNEYRYASYDTKALPEIGSPDSINFKPTVQTVTSQLVYKLNWTR